MSRYQISRELGGSHETAVLFESKNTVDEEIQNTRDELEPAELHTVIANARSDISGIAILLAGISAQQRKNQWLLVIAIVVLSVIAFRM